MLPGTKLKPHCMNETNGTTMMKRNNRVNTVFLGLLLSMMTASVAVAASPLAKPKADGLIGEQANGYIGFVKHNVPADIKKLVNEANANRKSGYQKIATKQGTSLKDVEKVGGQTAMEKTLRGNFIRDASGRWRKK